MRCSAAAFAAAAAAAAAPAAAAFRAAQPRATRWSVSAASPLRCVSESSGHAAGASLVCAEGGARGVGARGVGAERGVGARGPSVRRARGLSQWPQRRRARRTASVRDGVVSEATARPFSVVVVVAAAAATATSTAAAAAAARAARPRTTRCR